MASKHNTQAHRPMSCQVNLYVATGGKGHWIRACELSIPPVGRSPPRLHKQLNHVIGNLSYKIEHVSTDETSYTMNSVWTQKKGACLDELKSRCAQTQSASPTAPLWPTPPPQRSVPPPRTQSR